MNRPKLLIIGSGFHKNILGNCNSSLSCWKTLLKAVAKRRKIDTTDVPFDQPALAWESLVINGAGQKKDSKDASQTEKELRKTVVDIISSEMEAYNDRYQQCSFSISLKGFKGHIVNLNFDHMLDKLLGVQPIPKPKPSDSKIPPLHKARKKDAKGLYRRWKFPRDDGMHVTVWHPHGTVQEEESLRLGLRDYGFQPILYSEAFNLFKKWERDACAQNKKQQITTQDYQKILQKAMAWDNEKLPSLSDKNLHNNWVSRFMLFDVYMIGAGISESEWGLRWLLVQRHRNLARVEPKNRPQTVFLDVKENYPTGLMDYNISSSWDQAWHKALT
jgi:hypothetical protein